MKVLSITLALSLLSSTLAHPTTEGRTSRTNLRKRQEAVSGPHIVAVAARAVSSGGIGAEVVSSGSVPAAAVATGSAVVGGGAASASSSTSSSAPTASSSGAGNASGAASSTATSAAAAQSTGAAASGAGGSSNSTAAGAPAANLDMTVLQFALQLERLESTFYQQALQKFSPQTMLKLGLNAFQVESVVQTLSSIFADETAHVGILTSTIQSLGGTPSTKCQFNFGSSLDSLQSFVQTARLLELVGVGAYLGGAGLISDKTILTAAGSILTIEARHQSFLNILNGGSFAAQPFDIPMSPQQVLALAGQFLTGCTAQDLGLTANQPLQVTPVTSSFGIGGVFAGTPPSSSSKFVTGTQLAFQVPSTTNLTQQSSGMFCQMLVGGAPASISLPLAKCVVPPGINGPVAVFLTNDQQPLNANILQQNAPEIVAGPAVIFVDSGNEVLQGLFANIATGQYSGGSNVGNIKGVKNGGKRRLLPEAGSSSEQEQ